MNYTAKHQQNIQPVYCTEIEVNERYEHYCNKPYTTVTRPGKTYTTFAEVFQHNIVHAITSIYLYYK